MHKFDTYIFETDTRVASVNHDLVEFENTIFYPGGGGQPCDTGKVDGIACAGKVIEAFKRDGKIVHKVIMTEGRLNPGDAVRLAIDRGRRLALARAHTGEHLFFQSLQRQVPESKVIKVDLDVAESSLFVESNRLDWETVFEAEKLANKIIKENRKVVEHSINKADVDKVSNLRIKTERIAAEDIRVIEIEDFDKSACAGTHVRSTGEVGSMLVTKLNVAKGNWEIRFIVDTENTLLAYARIARSSSAMLGINVESVTESIRRIMDENDNLKTRYRTMSSRFLDFYATEQIGKVKLKYALVEDVEKKQLTDKASSFVEDNTIVCFMNRSGTNNTILLSSSTGYDMPSLLRQLIDKVGGKGGGRDNFAMGTVDETDAALAELKKLIAKL